MQNVTANWREDWQAFVRLAAESFSQGMDERAVTQLYGGKPATWTGVIAGKRLNGDRPGIKMRMPVVSFDLSDGRRVTVNHLFLHLRPENVASWQDPEIGSTVRFQTLIEADGIFPGIQWLDTEDNCATLLFGTKGGIALAVIANVEAAKD